ncbi:DUF2617 family protein [Brevibacterium daeguense]|uniref:DUF2617 family protein n=1 Tax=Brevibacterium daeguense TaxID=909936 RepID=A0ABP8ELE1_9MICO|nr:DUF2617 family protein [Brevibacterium daeguense]
MIESLSLPFADTSAAELTFARTLPRLPAVSSTVVPLAPNVRLELNVLGCSHQVIIVDGARDVLVETLACLPGTPPDLPASDSRSDETTAGAGHSFRSRVERAEPRGFRRAVDRIVDTAQARPFHCIARFPGHPAAVTALALERPEAGGLRWRTWHCYPQHGEIVHTRTRVADLPWSLHADEHGLCEVPA